MDLYPIANFLGDCGSSTMGLRSRLKVGDLVIFERVSSVSTHFAHLSKPLSRNVGMAGGAEGDSTWSKAEKAFQAYVIFPLTHFPLSQTPFVSTYI